jgi:hypothetical protein
MNVVCEPQHCPFEPTAKQLVAELHDTSPSLPALVVPLASTDHEAPSHIQTSPPPTATHRVALGHAIPPRRPAVVPVGTIDHAVPFHCSIRRRSVPEEMRYHPTAKQFAGPEHATSWSVLVTEPVGLGAGTTDHDAPFQCSTSARVAAGVDEPTATQNDVLVHVTPSSPLCAPPGGGEAIFHVEVEASQRSSSVRTLETKTLSLVGKMVPAAKHVVAVAHATVDASLFGPAFATVTVAHVEPSQRLIHGLIPEEYEYENPAEKHRVLLAQATLGNMLSTPPGILVLINVQVAPFQRPANGRWPPPEL